jgi:hypothetical protein
MFGFIRKLFRQEDNNLSEIPLEALMTTIAYPDGSKRTAYRNNPSARVDQVPAEVRALLTEIGVRYPQVAEHISMAWGSELCEQYLTSILFDERATARESHYTARAGFDPHIMSLLMQLQDEHNRYYGKTDLMSNVVAFPSANRRHGLT